MSTHTSHYDPSRETVGAIYRNAQLTNRVDRIETGEMTHEIMKSMVDDLNEAIVDGAKEFQNREFYITVHEKKDAQMPSCILRRMIKTLYRPWPEDDTLVFRIFPTSNDVYFCWCLDHWTVMENKLASAELFDPVEINQIRAWKNYDLTSFGFSKLMNGNWIPNLEWVDQRLGAPQSRPFSLFTP